MATDDVDVNVGDGAVSWCSKACAAGIDRELVVLALGTAGLGWIGRGWELFAGAAIAAAVAGWTRRASV